MPRNRAPSAVREALLNWESVFDSSRGRTPTFGFSSGEEPDWFSTSEEIQNVDSEGQMKIHEIFASHRGYLKPTIESHPMVVSTEMLGVEVELEKTSGILRSNYWITKNDGSLRNQGREYVFRAPIGGVDLFNALSEAGRFFYETKPDASWRCSTHVHLDVRDLEVSELKNLLILYVIFEEVLFKCSGYNRYKNNFGPAYGFAQDQITTLSMYWERDGSDFLNPVLDRWSKYSSLNLLPIARFGSIEFRISNAMTSTSDLLRLCNRVLLLKKLACEWVGTQEELIISMRDTDVSTIFNKKLTGFLQHEFTQEDVNRGCVLANDMIHLQKYKTKQLSSGGLPTVLTAGRMRSIRNLAEENRHRSEDWNQLYLWSCDVYDNNSYSHISPEKASLICRMIAVNKEWVVQREHTHLFEI